jgi:hypothetical protein
MHVGLDELRLGGRLGLSGRFHYRPALRPAAADQPPRRQAAQSRGREPMKIPPIEPLVLHAVFLK